MHGSFIGPAAVWFYILLSLCPGVEQEFGNFIEASFSGIIQGGMSGVVCPVHVRPVFHQQGSKIVVAFAGGQDERGFALPVLGVYGGLGADQCLADKLVSFPGCIVEGSGPVELCFVGVGTCTKQ